MIPLITQRLTKDEAYDGLIYGLQLLDPVLNDTDGDGPWSQCLLPPAEIEVSVAGYIFGALASPQVNLRWEAAHVVRTLCVLGCKEVADALIFFANGAPRTPFCDARLFFYEMHARQWLLIGLASAAEKNPLMISSYTQFLREMTFLSEPHVFIRESGKRALQALQNAGFTSAEENLPEQISSVNKSIFPFVDIDYHHQYLKAELDSIEAEEGENEHDSGSFYFGFDIGPYWLAPLGSCFAKSQTSIERIASQIIREKWHINYDNLRAEDERHRLGILSYDQTQHSHGSHPQAEDLHFYLSYHAMMVAAGMLLNTTPIHRHPNEGVDEFTCWFRRHDLSLGAKGWLADRRDPKPMERPNWKNEAETEEWFSSISKEYLERVLLCPDGRLNLWGYWTWVSDHREETIRVSSALVSPKNSLALLRALQSVSNPHDYRIPDAGDEMEINFEGFQLKGWISDRERHSGLDDMDPWAGSISFPPPEPDKEIIEIMGLISDKDHRRWSTSTDNKVVAWSQTWGEYCREEGECERGARFQVLLPFTISLLRALGRDLIVEIEIERRKIYQSWERRGGYDTESRQSITKLFLIRSDNEIVTL
jgi:hypothetical protein